MDTNEQTILELRATLERERREAQMRVERDNAQLNEISRINNELVNTQRELASSVESARQDAERVRVSETRYRRLFEAAQDGILILDAETGEIEDVNPFLCQLLRFEPQDLIGKQLWEMATFRHIATHRDAFLMLQEHEYIRYEDVQLETKDEQSISIEFVSSIYRSNDKKIVQCNIRDIRERRVAEALSARLSAIVESSQHAIISTTLNGIVTTWNAGAQKLYGYTAQEVIGRPVSFLAPPDLSNEMPQLLGKIRRGEPIEHYETVHLRKDGSRLDISLSISPVRDKRGKIIGVSSIEQDITERKQAEQALQKSEQEQRQLAEHMEKERTRLAEAQAVAKLGSWELDLATNALIWSDELYRVFGVNRDKFQASYDAFLERVHPDDRAAVNTAYMESIANHTPYAIEHRIQMDDGSIRIVHERCRTSYDDDGRPLRSLGTTQDITERKQAEEELRFRKALLEAQTEASPSGILVVSGEGDILSCNQRFLQMWDIPQQIADNRDDAQALRSILGKLVAPQQFLDKVTYLYKHQDEQSEEEIALIDGRVFNRYSAPVASPGGFYYGRVWYFSDITERKHAEAALKASESRYHSLFENMLEGYAYCQTLFVGDQLRDFVYLEVNSAFEKLTGLKDVVGNKVSDVIPRAHETSRDLLEMYGRVALTGKPEKCETYLEPLDIWLSVAAYSLEREHFVAVFDNITKRKRAENALVESEERFRLMAESVDEVFWLFDPIQERLLYVSPSFEKTWGFPSQRLMDNTMTFIDTVYPDDRDRILAALEHQGEPGGYDEEHRIVHPDGSVRWVWGRTFPIYKKSGEVYRIAGIAQDITDRKQAEADLQKANDELELRVKERTAELEAAHQEMYVAKQEADEANLAKSEFLSRMSHELRTPLNAILGFGQILDRQELAPLPKESVGHILQAGRHLLDLINEVLDITRVEAGRMELSLEPIAADDIISEACALMRTLASKRNIGIRFNEGKTKSGGKHIMADRQRLRQVLLNLLGNAIKYNRDGGEIEIFYTQMPHERIAIAVRDTGTGIAPGDLNKLFTPFERLDAENSQIEGTGLGLVVSQRLMAAMGGTLTVQSTLGEGSTFAIELLQTDSPQKQVATMPYKPSFVNVEQGADGTYTVLCIEDNPSNLRLMETVFDTRPDITVLTAMLGSIGLDLARQHEPDLILLDLNLPDVHGSEVLTCLRRSALTRDIPVVVLTADAMPGQMKQVLAAGAKGYLTKPLDVDQFLTMVDQFLHSPPQIATQPDNNEENT